MFNLGFHGSHNATLAISYKETVLEAVEVERFISHKNAALFYYENPSCAIDIIREINNYFIKKYDVDEYENIIINSVDQTIFNFDDVFKYNNLKYMGHHEAHCYSSLYQSPYDEALVVSFDGGSDQKFFNVFYVKKGFPAKRIYSGKKDYAISYMTPAHFIKDIKREDNIYNGNLVYPGKLMGYVGFGDFNEDMEDRLIRFYHSNNYDNIPHAIGRFMELFSKYGITEWISYFSEKDGKDIAITNQLVFEKLFYEEVFDKTFISDLYGHLPLILTGGCALNIIHNTNIAKDREVYVSPNPSDVGLAVGMLCGCIKPTEIVDTTYIGPPVWDRSELSRHLFEREYSKLDIEKLVDVILNGNVVGVVRGRSEHGPRALGNRSLLCDATNPDMKDFMNSKIKNREWFRPFSPIVRLEDLNKYFEWTKESRCMTFSPPVRQEYRDKLRSVTHVDGTARVQTVTREQNEFIYDLLTMMDKKIGCGILLNTSFNVAGKPILNTYKDALWMLDNKDISGLVLEDYYIL
tara:strand:- start:106 stop:1668 length:1563 start_codon:yes stop_codon:yes gene_type:complete